MSLRKKIKKIPEKFHGWTSDGLCVYSRGRIIPQSDLVDLKPSFVISKSPEKLLLNSHQQNIRVWLCKIWNLISFILWFVEPPRDALTYNVTLQVRMYTLPKKILNIIKKKIMFSWFCCPTNYYHVCVCVCAFHAFFSEYGEATAS